MSLMDMFRTAPVQPAQPAKPVLTPEQIAAAANPTVPNANAPGSDGSVKAFPIAAKGEASPLADFGDLWKPDPNAKPAASLVPEFNIDPKKLMETSRGIDFSKQISAAAMEAAKAGDPSQAINEAVQAGFAQSFGAAAQLLKDAMSQQAKTFNETIMPEVLRRNEISRGLSDDNKLFDNPAVAPMLKMVERQFADKYPTAPASEVTAKAKEFIKQFGNEIVTSSGQVVSDKPAAAAPGARSRETDWSLFSGESSS